MRETLNKPCRRNAFTLIEMLAVLGIVGIMMVIAVGAFDSMGRGQGLRGGVLNVRSSLALARQYAVTHRERATLVVGNGMSPAGRRTGYYVITNSAGQAIGATNFLTDGIVFTNTSPDRIEFKYDGSCGGNSRSWPQLAGGLGREIVIKEDRPKYSLTATTVVFRLTGQAKSKVWVDN